MTITLPLKTNAPPPLWEDLKGKPYVIVSSKGLANGLSNIINDGADFGPDTPGTTTCGIQEAINTGYPVKLLIGDFVITSEITNGNQTSFILVGSGLGGNPATDGYDQPKSGTRIHQMTPGANIIRLASPVTQFIFGNMSLYWDSSIAGTNTGHGLFIDAETYANSLPGNPTEEQYTMAQQMTFYPLYVYGVDTGHYAYWLENCNPSSYIPSLLANTQGGFLRFRSFRCSTDIGSATRNSGNCTIGYMAGYCGISSTVPTISFDTLNNNPSYPYPHTNIIRILYLDVEMQQGTATSDFIYMDEYSQMIQIVAWNQGDIGTASIKVNILGNYDSVAPDSDFASNVSFNAPSSTGSGWMMIPTNIVLEGPNFGQLISHKGPLTLNADGGGSGTYVQTYSNFTIYQALALQTPQTTLTGTTAGTVVWSQPEIGSATKKVVAYLNGYENTTTTSQTISFPTAFTNPPLIISQPPSFNATATTSTLILPNSMSAPVTGWIIIEGF